MSNTQRDYNIWWNDEGSSMKPLKNEDIEEFANRLTKIAWNNAVYCKEVSLEKMIKVQKENVIDEYMKGLYNGMIFSLSILTDKEPVYFGDDNE